MTYRPGTQILVSDGSPPRTAPTDTSTFFAVGQVEKGSYAAPVVLTSETQMATKIGARTGFTAMFDAIVMAFRDGAAEVIVGRVIGDVPVKATANIYDQSGSSAPGDVSLVITAKSAGEWGNKLNYTVDQTGSGNTAPYEIVITHDDDGELERSGSLADRDAAVTWAATAEFVDIALGASAQNPRDASETSLASGDDDDDTIDQGSIDAALALFTEDLGPGQVAAPGVTTTAAHEALLTHAKAFNRFALLDSADTATVATLTAEADALRAGLLQDEERYGMLLAPWVTCPGVLPGTTRTVPPSGMVAGLMARNDQNGISQNKPSANQLGISRFALGVSQTWTSAGDRDELNTAGVNVIRELYDEVRLYGYRTVVDADSDPNWLNAANVRMLMRIIAECNVVAERYVLSEIDGAGIAVSSFGGELRATLLPHFNAGSLYGASPEEAFIVDVGPGVNTDETLAAQELRAVIGIRFSPYAELVTVELVKVPASEVLS